MSAFAAALGSCATDGVAPSAANSTRPARRGRRKPSSPRSRSETSRSSASSASAAASSHGPRSRAGGICAMSIVPLPAGGWPCSAGAGVRAPRLSARRNPSAPGEPYQPGGCRVEGRGSSAPSASGGSGCAPGGGAPSRPKPSSVSMGASGASPSPPATPPESATSRRIICTKRPESGRSLHSAVAVMWNSTTRPWPRFSKVTSGVPSASRAHTRSARRGEGSASTCRSTVTSGGTARPAKGEPWPKGARRCGCSHESEPPSCRSARSRTGSSESGRSARRGPAKRMSVPPPSTNRVSACCSGPSATGRSARTRTESGRWSSRSTSPRRSSAKGDSARSR